MPNTRRPSPSARRRKGGGSPGKIALYALVIGLGAYGGAQAYARLNPPKAAPATQASVRSEDPEVATDMPEPTHTEEPESDTPPVEELETPEPEPDKPAPPEDEPEKTPEPAAPNPASDYERYPGIEIDRATSGRPEVALTFDAGADWKPTRQILEALAKAGVKSTFFLTGEWVEENPKTTKRIAAEGHEIGNHSWDHPAFTSLTNEQIREQLDRTDTIIQATTGRSSRPYFRPPLGARDARVRRAVGEQGFLSIYWTIDSHDSVVKGITAAQIRDRVLKNIEPGSIVLMHCGSQATADALPEILAALKTRNLTPVPVSKLLPK